MSNSIVQANDLSFDTEVLAAPNTVLVDFGAAWCGPCKRLKPVLEQLAKDMPDLKIVEVDVDDSPLVSAKYGIRSVPTLIVFKNGQKTNLLVGLSSAEKIKAIL